MNFIKQVVQAASKHYSAVLTGLGIAGTAAAVGLAVWGTAKAVARIEEKKKERLADISKVSDDITEAKTDNQFRDIRNSEASNGTMEENAVKELSAADIFKTVWRFYVPAAALFSVSIFCLIFAQTKASRKYAALLAAYDISESSLREYCAKTLETVGAKKEAEIRDAVAKDNMDKNPLKNSEIIITDSDSETLCYDPLSGRYFKSSADKIRRALNCFNRELISEGTQSLNNFYDLIGLDDIRLGDSIGWFYDIQNGIVDPRFSSHLAADGTPCLVVGFNRPPVYGFDD